MSGCRLIQTQQLGALHQRVMRRNCNDPAQPCLFPSLPTPLSQATSEYPGVSESSMKNNSNSDFRAGKSLHYLCAVEKEISAAAWAGCVRSRSRTSSPMRASRSLARSLLSLQSSDQTEQVLGELTAWIARIDMCIEGKYAHEHLRCVIDRKSTSLNSSN